MNSATFVRKIVHQLGQGRFHLVLHLADQLILPHVLVVQRLRIAVGKCVKVVGVEYALGDQPGQDHEQPVGIGNIAGNQRFVDDRQLPVVVFLDRLAHLINVAVSGGHASGRSSDQRSTFQAKGKV